MKLEDDTKSSTSQLQVLREFSHPFIFYFYYFYFYYYYYYYYYFLSFPYYILRTICLISLGVG
ncbi:MAG: hypothetical protein K7J15_01880, partial [Candidatus Regiella insecticola]|nr:hypothetical protein [Candidatus Regiella insecticola]